VKFYLSGGMEYKKGLGKTWRDNITEELSKVDYEVFNPVLQELDDEEAKSYNWKENKLLANLDSYRHMVRAKMFVKDMVGIQQSNAVVLLYDESVQRGAGTLAEAWEAFREAKPLYIISQFSRENIPGWLIGESTALFRTISDFIEYVSNKDRVRADVRQAKKVRDQYLGEIY